MPEARSFTLRDHAAAAAAEAGCGGCVAYAAELGRVAVCRSRHLVGTCPRSAAAAARHSAPVPRSSEPRRRRRRLRQRRPRFAYRTSINDDTVRTAVISNVHHHYSLTTQPRSVGEVISGVCL